jgi:hypothetical protein
VFRDDGDMPVQDPRHIGDRDPDPIRDPDDQVFLGSPGLEVSVFEAEQEGPVLDRRLGSN